jgi:hypothetical protein
VLLAASDVLPVNHDELRQMIHATRPIHWTTTSCISPHSQAVTLMKQVAKMTGIFLQFIHSNLR